MVEVQAPALPPAYMAAFDAFAAAWTAERRALGHAVLHWLVVTPPMNSVRPRRVGDELEWRLITYAEWDALRLALAEALRAHSNDTLIATVLAIKDFHRAAFSALPHDLLARHRSTDAP